MKKRGNNVPHAIEIKWASLMLSMIAIMLSALMLREDHPYIAVTDYEHVLAVLLMVSGVVHGIGAWIPRRPLRQAGLILGAITWFAIGLSFLADSWLSYSAFAGSFGLLWFSCYVRDVLRKPRERRATTT